MLQPERRLRILLATLGLALVGVAGLAVSPYLNASWRPAVREVSSALVTAALVSFIWDRVAFASLVDEVQEGLGVPLDGYQLSEHGLRTFVEGAFYSDVHASMVKSSRLLIVQTWSPDTEPFLREARAMLERGGSVQIYLLNPDSLFAAQRSRDLGTGEGVVKGKIELDTESIRALHRDLIARRWPGTLELSYYNSIPAFAVYATDEKAWVGFYWYGNQSDNGTTLVIHRPSRLWSEFERHIEILRSRSVAVNLT